MTFVDANYFLRYLVAPTPETWAMHVTATALFEAVERGDEEATTSEAVLAEVAFILSSKHHYGLPAADIAAYLTPVLALPGLVLPRGRKRLYLRALEIWSERPRLGFVDALTAAEVDHAGIPLATFDHDFDDIRGLGARSAPRRVLGRRPGYAIGSDRAGPARRSAEDRRSTVDTIGAVTSSVPEGLRSFSPGLQPRAPPGATIIRATGDRHDTHQGRRRRLGRGGPDHPPADPATARRPLRDRRPLRRLARPPGGHRRPLRHPPDRRHADATALAARPDLDAIFVLDSDEYHADHTIAALRHGKHVLVEKPMCLTLHEAESIIDARDAAGRHVVVAYMRRFAPAFLRAVDEVARLPKINYVRVRDIIGANRLIIEQSSAVLRFDDLPAAAKHDRAERADRLVADAIGDAPPELRGVYRLLCGLSSHDLSALRELVGAPKRVVAARWNGGRFLSAIFKHDGFHTVFETGIDLQRRFDAHLEVYGDTRSIRVQYDTPYIRHLPTTLVVQETVGDAFVETVVRPTYTDPYTRELEHFHDVVTGEATPKTTPEDFIADLRLFRAIIDALRHDQGSPPTAS